METIQGLAVNQRYDEMSPLDRAINKYSQQADKYFKELNELENAPADVRAKREKELEKAKTFLEHERRFAELMAATQADLDSYRGLGRDATQGTRSEVAAKQTALASEEHHPTDVLEKFMRSIPIPKPSSVHTAHHIVPGRGKTKDANLARVRMHRFGVRINDPDNGVWLPRFKSHTPHWSMPDSKGHLQYHTHGYESWVFKKLRSKSSEVFIRQELRLIGQLLQSNKIPDEARKKKS